MQKISLEAMENMKAIGESAGKDIGEIERMEQKIDDMRDKYFKKQIQRLKKGKCKPQSGIVFSEVLTDLREWEIMC